MIAFWLRQSSITRLVNRKWKFLLPIYMSLTCVIIMLLALMASHSRITYFRSVVELNSISRKYSLASEALANRFTARSSKVRLWSTNENKCCNFNSPGKWNIIEQLVNFQIIIKMLNQKIYQDSIDSNFHNYFNSFESNFSSTCLT